MSRIRGRNTKPELAVRSLLHRLGYRFRLHVRDLPGRPDIVLSRHRLVVLVHGCFWHRHSGCRFGYAPKTRVDFWRKKFEGNIRRDREVQLALKKIGWRVMVVWECEVKDVRRLNRRLHGTLDRIQK
jgi:DNA mismatch endonuclease (patch repair protein)